MNLQAKKIKQLEKRMNRQDEEARQAGDQIAKEIIKHVEQRDEEIQQTNERIDYLDKCIKMLTACSILQGIGIIILAVQAVRLLLLR